MSNFRWYNTASTHGKFLQELIDKNQEADRLFDELMSMMVQMLDGDGAQDAHFATMQVRFGFDSVADARAAFNELQSAYGKTKGDDQVAFVRSARQQLYARLTV